MSSRERLLLGQASYVPQDLLCSSFRTLEMHGDVPCSTLINPALLLGPMTMVFSDLGIGSLSGESLG